MLKFWRFSLRNITAHNLTRMNYVKLVTLKIHIPNCETTYHQHKNVSQNASSKMQFFIRPSHHV